MTLPTYGAPPSLARLADAVLLLCFDGLTAPDWVRRRVGDGLGGVCLFARNIGTAHDVAALSASLTAERADVIVAIDEEAGDVTRLDSATGSRFPGAYALGRADDPDLTEAIAREVGSLLRAAGVSLNLAPCADVAIDPANPVIGSRSFGTDPALVAHHTAAWVRGQQSAGVAACAKHFPGHGDTSADSHRSVAVLSGGIDEIRRTALPPFVAAIAAGTAAIMPGHLLVPAVDDVPATVSRRWITEILRGELGFTGTIVTDALEMAGVAAVYGIPGAAVAALVAGSDLLCIGGETRPEEEIDAIRDAIVAAVLDGTLPEERLAAAASASAALGAAATRMLAHDAPAASPHAADASMTAARHALEVVGPLPHVSDPILVIRCSETPNIAVGVIPWGPATVLPPSAGEIVVHAGQTVPAEALAGAASVLIVTRDRHRFPWMVDLIHSVRARRPDAVIVEMGISGVHEADAPAVASFGATLANTRAVLEVLSEVAVTA